MNYQSNRTKLQMIDSAQAAFLINEKFPEADSHQSYMQYYAWPQTFSTTAGPFTRSGLLAGPAISTFTIECWHDGKYGVLFCKGRVWKTVELPIEVAFGGYRSE